MARLNRSDDTGANREGPGRLSIPQGRFRTQQDVIGDSLLQLGGRGEVQPGGGDVNDPLNAPFVLYVNPYTGRDDFAFGSYATADDGSVNQELRRIESQRLVCGYTEAAPFRTINRAAIEAGLITSKAYFSAGTIPFQQVCIVLAPGTYTALCAGGLADSDANFPDWANDAITDAWLTGFNPETVGGIILPRGCSLISLDLRKTIIRPIAAAVPDPADEAANFGNRRTILRMTGEGYYYGMTFMDADGVDTSHHLMSCFEFASEAQLADFYDKIERKFAGVAGTNVNAVAERQTEFEIVGPQPNPGTQTQATDTTASASPYIYNTSIRSTLGLCGVFCNGAVVEGFRSCVIAQFTSVSLQNDFSVQDTGTCWQIYDEGTDSWGNLADFGTYRAASPNNVRMNPNRRSFHIRAVNRAVIQEVSVFAIGQGVHHWVESGGEITVTNSNSNFGGAAAIAEGHWDITLPQDNNFPVSRIKVPTDLSEKRNNIREITLGTTVANQGGGAAVTAITLQEALTGDEDLRPDILDQEGFSLAPGTQVWIENPEGNDWTARLDTDAWEVGTPAVINVANAFATGTLAGAGGGAAPGADALQSRRVYVRRLIDTRTTDERTYALILNRPANARTPVRDYIIQNQAGSIGVPNLCAVQAPRRNNEVAGIDGVQIMLRQQCPQQSGNPSLTDVQQFRNYYRLGDTIRTQNKHWQATVEHYQTGNAPDLTNFAQQNVHTETGTNATDADNNHNPEDYFKNATPIIVFDADLSTEINERQAATAPIGIELDASENDSVWTAAGSWAVGNAAATATSRLRNEVQAQYRTATDYRGLHTALSTIWNLNNGPAVEALEPQLEADRLTNPPSNQTVDFRRPSQIRLFGHAYEWSGYLNYTKALPQYQGELSRENKFTYYGTSKDGGRVYFSGFNEEGALVTPAGLTDITTGETIAPEELDPIEPPCEFFDCLTVNRLTLNSELNLNSTTISGTPVWNNGVLPVATEAIRGITRLATQAQVNAFNSTQGGGTAPAAVTPETLQGVIVNPGTPLDNTNLLINGQKVINQREHATPNTPGNGVYGWDRWRGNTTDIGGGQTNNLEQVVEFLPAGQYTLSYQGGGRCRVYTTNGTVIGNSAQSPFNFTLAADTPDNNRVIVVVRNDANNIQLERGNTATPFQVRNIAVEALMCMRYYERMVQTGGTYDVAMNMSLMVSLGRFPDNTPSSYRAIGSMTYLVPKQRAQHNLNFPVFAGQTAGTIRAFDQTDLSPGGTADNAIECAAGGGNNQFQALPTRGGFSLQINQQLGSDAKQFLANFPGYIADAEL